MDSLLSYQTLPLKIKSQLARITESWKAHAGENLVGVYLHGSIALGAFQPASGREPPRRRPRKAPKYLIAEIQK